MYDIYWYAKFVSGTISTRLRDQNRLCQLRLVLIDCPNRSPRCGYPMITILPSERKTHILIIVAVQCTGLSPPPIYRLPLLHSSFSPPVPTDRKHRAGRAVTSAYLSADAWFSMFILHLSRDVSAPRPHCPARSTWAGASRGSPANPASGGFLRRGRRGVPSIRHARNGR